MTKDEIIHELKRLAPEGNNVITIERAAEWFEKKLERYELRTTWGILSQIVPEPGLRKFTWGPTVDDLAERIFVGAVAFGTRCKSHEELSATAYELAEAFIKHRESRTK